MVALHTRLYPHMAWADAVLWRSVYDREDLLADPFVIESLFHVHYIQRAYLALWRREPVAQLTPADIGGPDEIRAWGRAYHEEVADFLHDLSSDRLPEVIEIPWSRMIEELIGRRPEPVTLSDTLVQVALHSVHHRAQTNRRIRELGGTPSMIDYIAWVWLGLPEPDWPD